MAFLLAIKLLIKYTIAVIEVKIISETLTIPIVSSLPIAPFNGINNPIRQIKVNKTAICAITLFSFLSPGAQNKRAHPKTTGIIAVPEELSR